MKKKKPSLKDFHLYLKRRGIPIESKKFDGNLSKYYSEYLATL